MISSFSEASYLMRGLPHPCFEQAQFQRLFGHHLFQSTRLVTQMTDFTSRGVTHRIARKSFLPGLEKLLRPRIIQTVGYTPRGVTTRLRCSRPADISDQSLPGCRLRQGFLAHASLRRRYDEPEILLYSIHQFPPIGPDAGQNQWSFPRRTTQ